MIEPAVAVKVTVLAPFPTETVAGTVKAEELLLIVTVAPVAGAACVRPIVQVTVPKAFTVVGVQFSDETPSVKDPASVTLNDTGCRPFTSAMAMVVVPMAPLPRFRVVEASPWALVEMSSEGTDPLPCVIPK